MAFDIPSVATEKRKAREKKKNKKPTTTKGNTVKEEKEFNKFGEAVKPVFDKKEGMKKELALVQLEDAITKGNRNLSNKSIKKVADAAADDAQLTRSLRKMERDLFRGGGRAGFKSGSKGCKMATKGKGRAYGKNS